MSVVEGKVALVTGGAGGIGFSYVRGLLKHGAKGVTIADVDQSKGEKAAQALAEEFGSERVIFVRTDVTSEFELENAFKKAVDNFQQLDIVINNAGIVNEVQWEKTIAVNFISTVRGTLLAKQKYLPKYHTGEHGTIVNTCSIAGLMSLQTMPVYCATKHALIGLSRSLGSARHFEKSKIRILTLCPGLTTTELSNNANNEDLLGDYKDFFAEDSAPLLPQPPEVMEDAIVDLLRKGSSGSIWVIECNELNEVIMPDYHTLYKKQA